MTILDCLVLGIGIVLGGILIPLLLLLIFILGITVFTEVKHYIFKIKSCLKRRIK